LSFARTRITHLHNKLTRLWRAIILLQGVLIDISIGDG
jgi:hypothetical protein